MEERETMKITVCTQNMKNKFDFIMRKSKLNYYDEESEKVKNILNDVNIDIMGLQEMTVARLKRLQNGIKDGYHLYKGKGRMNHFPAIISYNCIYRAYNEYNSLVASDKFQLASSTTYVLPWWKDVKNQLFGGALMPRIASVFQLKNKEIGTLNVMNTHLDYHSSIVQEQQLKKLTEILSELDGPVIMMGDFNMFPNNPLFTQYRTIWENEFQLKMVELPEELKDKKTWIGKEGNLPKENAPYDYIFATPELKLIFSTTMDYTPEQSEVTKQEDNTEKQPDTKEQKNDIQKPRIQLPTDHKAMVAEFEIETHKER